MKHPGIAGHMFIGEFLKKKIKLLSELDTVHQRLGYGKRAHSDDHI